ncbi:MAG: rod shape-determining protein MreC [Methylococcales bacterium]|nr:rod shape-determining protein MreC [Methylococcales bacterium]
MFASGPSINTRLLITGILSLAMLITEHQTDRLAPLRSAVSVLTYPVQELTDWPYAQAGRLLASVRSIYQLSEQNTRLKQELLINKTKMLKFDALESENIRLRALLEKSFTLGEQILVAELLSVNLAPYEHRVVIDKGQRFGIHDRQPVLDAQGVFGQIYRTLPFSAEVILITDPSHALPVQVNRNSLRTVAVGNGKINELLLPYLPNNADIRVGDLLTTSGLGGVFPKGYPVGEITSITIQQNKPFALVTAKPKAHLDRSREVLVVWNDRQPIAIAPPEPEPEPKLYLPEIP